MVNRKNKKRSESISIKETVIKVLMEEFKPNESRLSYIKQSILDKLKESFNNSKYNTQDQDNLMVNKSLASKYSTAKKEVDRIIDRTKPQYISAISLEGVVINRFKMYSLMERILNLIDNITMSSYQKQNLQKLFNKLELIYIKSDVSKFDEIIEKGEYILDRIINQKYKIKNND